MAGISYVNQSSTAVLMRKAPRSASALPRPMTVGPGRGGELAAEVYEGDELLAARLEIPELDLAGDELVAEDHREVGVVPGGRFQLLAQLASRELGPNGKSGGAQVGGDPESVGG